MSERRKETIKYARKSDGCFPEEAFEMEIDSAFKEHEGDLAREIGEDYHYNHDGWEANWPIKFEVWDKSNKKIAEIEVEREAVPHFRLA